MGDDFQYTNLCMGCMNQRQIDSDICSYCKYQEQVPDHTLHLAPWTVLNDQYIVGRVLGQGGFGITYLAFDINLHKKVAIKEFFPAVLVQRETSGTTVIPLSGDATKNFTNGLNDFVEEGRQVSQFNHPNIVRVYNFFRNNNTAYIVMDYLDGLDLDAWVRECGGTLPLAEALEVMESVFSALTELHKVNVYHRDISPNNIYRTHEGQLILLDFGAARHIVGEYSKSLDIILKPGYAPIEQYGSRGPIGPWTDVYACAATLYVLLSGKLPPAAPDRIMNDELMPLSEISELQISSEISDAILHALSVRHEYRFQTVEEFRQALREAVAIRTEPPNTDMTELPSEPPVPAKRPKAAVLAGLALIVLVAAISTWFWLTPASERVASLPQDAKNTQNLRNAQDSNNLQVNQGSRRPIVEPNTTDMYHRVLTLPGATLVAEPGGKPIEKMPVYNGFC